jgi:pyruvate/2-oxoglutarate/acetoin dehydrogenase E1 component
MRYVESINAALHKMMARDNGVILIGEDLLDPYGGAFKASRGLSTAFPDQVITTPISEAGFVGAAIGLAMRGYKPIAEIMFGDFITLAADQIVNHAAKFPQMFRMKLPLVIRAPMGGYRGYGPTHSQSLEAMFMPVPGLTIVAPSHAHDVGGLLERALYDVGAPVLFVESKGLYPEELAREPLVNPASLFPTARVAIEPGGQADVTLIAYGGLAPMALEAATKAMMEDEILVEVLIPSQLRPIPFDDLRPYAAASGRILVLEEGPLLGALVVAGLAEQLIGGRTKVARVGARDALIPCAKQMEAQVLPSTEDVLHAIRRLMT